jgi:hypothetical protein
MSAAAKVSHDQAVKERLDDIAQMLGHEGHTRFSRSELTRRLVFALPVDNVDQTERILRRGFFRMQEDINGDWNDDADQENERMLAWYRDDRERAELISEIERLNKALQKDEWMIAYARTLLARVLESRTGRETTQ